MDDLIELVPGIKTGLLDYLVIFVDISEWSQDQFKGHPVVQALLESLQLASKHTLAANFDRVMERLKSVKHDPRIYDWLISFGLYAMAVDEIDAEQVEQGFSKVINKREAHKMSMTTAEKLLIQGEAEGRVKAGRAMVLRALRAKFRTVPKAVEKSIHQKNDPIVLESLLERAIQSDTLKEFAEDL
jgi:hypothetical protein